MSSNFSVYLCKFCSQSCSGFMQKELVEAACCKREVANATSFLLNYCVKQGCDVGFIKILFYSGHYSKFESKDSVLRKCVQSEPF